MKKFFLIITLFEFIKPVKACDVCGCGIRDASFNMGFAQSIQSNMLITGYQQLNLITQISGYSVNDRIIRFPIHYMHQLSEKWQAQIGTEVQQTQGINAYNENQIWSSVSPSDLYSSINFRLFDNRKNIFTPHHLLWFIGSSLKLPTGHYQIRDNEKRLLPMQLQAGNGAYSIGLQSQLSYRYQSWGLNTMFSHLTNTQNELSYKQGQQTQILVGINRAFNIGKSNHTFIPQIAYAFQHFQIDRQYNSKVPFSGGTIGSLKLQLEWIYKNIYASALYQIPQNVLVPKGAPVVQSSVQFKLGYLIPPLKKDQSLDPNK